MSSETDIFILCLTAKSFSHQLQLLVKLRAKELCLYHVFLTTTVNRWNFNGVYAGIFIRHFFAVKEHTYFLEYPPCHIGLAPIRQRYTYLWWECFDVRLSLQEINQDWRQGGVTTYTPHAVGKLWWHTPNLFFLLSSTQYYSQTIAALDLKWNREKNFQPKGSLLSPIVRAAISHADRRFLIDWSKSCLRFRYSF
jgi:hypothetical protein